MKKCLLSLLVAVTAFAAGATDPRIGISNFSIAAGETRRTYVAVFHHDWTTFGTTMYCDIYLPKGLKITGTGSTAPGVSVRKSQLCETSSTGADHYHFVATSSSRFPYQNTSVLFFDLECDETSSPGQVTIELRDGYLSNGSQSLSGLMSSCVVTITASGTPSTHQYAVGNFVYLIPAAEQGGVATLLGMSAKGKADKADCIDQAHFRVQIGDYWYICHRIASEAFSENTLLKYVWVHPFCTKIGAYAFNGCTNLRQLEMPGTLSELDAYAFKGCTSLSRVEYNGTTPCGSNSQLEGLDGTQFEGVPSTAVLHLPKIVHIEDRFAAHDT